MMIFFIQSQAAEKAPFIPSHRRTKKADTAPQFFMSNTTSAVSSATPPIIAYTGRNAARCAAAAAHIDAIHPPIAGREAMMDFPTPAIPLPIALKGAPKSPRELLNKFVKPLAF
jgi:hypothetical protein